MKKTCLYLLLPVLLLLLQGCNLEKEVDIELPPYESQLTVECYLTPGKPLRATILESVSYFEAPQVPLVRDAQVYLIHNDRRTELKFGPGMDKSSGKYFTHHSKELFNSRPGDVYFLEVKDAKGRMVTGSTTILKQVPIDTIEWKFNEKEKAYLLTSFQDDPAKNNFYRFMINRDSLQRSSSRDFVSSDELTNGQRVSFGTSYDFEQGDTVIVSLFHIEKQYHDFLGSVSDAKNANGNPFAQPSQIKSTVQGGIGVFTNLAFDRKTVIIKK